MFTIEVNENNNEIIMPEDSKSEVKLDNKIPEVDFDKKISLTNKELLIHGSPEQTKSMFEDLSKYFGDVHNPEASTINPFFKSKYAPLDGVLNTIRPILSKYGLALTQTTSIAANECVVSTLLTHKDGGYIYYPSLTGKPAKSDIQGIGATLTYLRRFAINAIAGVCGEVDDDGNKGCNNKPTVAQPKAASKPKNKETSQLKLKKEEIVKLAKKSIDGGVDSNILYDVISKLNNGNKNPNSIATIEICDQVIKGINDLKKESK